MELFNKRKFYTWFCFVFLLVPSIVRGVPSESSHVHPSLLAEVVSVQPGQPFWVAVQLKIDKEWHTYWAYPGDSGYPVSIEWNLTPGFKAGAIRWPTPERIVTPPLATYGYKDKVTLLVPITPPRVIRNLERVQMGASIRWLECKEECLPGQTQLHLDLPVDIQNPEPDSKVLEMFAEARFSLPLTESDWTVTGFQTSDLIVLSISNPSQPSARLKKVEFIPSQSNTIENAAPQMGASKKNVYQLVLEKSKLTSAPLERLSGVLLAEPGWRGPGSEKGLDLSIDLPMKEGGAIPFQPRASFFTFWTAVLFAFLGGILLNLMPCVLPVLSIKILGLIKQGTLTIARRSFSALFYGVGVVASFLILALVMILLRAGGEAIGWGFQLQSPVFVGLLTTFLFLVGLNFFGLFEVGVGFIGTNLSASQEGSWFGSLMSGVLATVVATPCTAPFMGSALGYAITVPPLQSLSIFSALGIGMALPYVGLAIFPGLLNLLPKPGPWMDHLKKVFGLLMMATVSWMLWVFTRQTSVTSLILTILGLAIITGAAWIYGRGGRILTAPASRRKSFLAAGALLVVGVGLMIFSTKVRGGVAITSPMESNWDHYSDERLSSLLKENRPVFIDFTASWCLTCQVNERVVLSSPEVQKVFQQKNVALLQADWTSRDPHVTQALERYRRNGVPTYVLYGADGRFQLLPEVLTKSVLLSALKQIR